MRSQLSPGLATVRLDGGQALSVWAGGFVLPLAEAARRCGVAAVAPASIRAALPDWDRWCGVVRQVTADGRQGDGWQAETEVTFLPSVTDPVTVYCAAANYSDHTKEMRGAEHGPQAQSPMFFVGTVASLNGHRQDVVRPAGCERLDWEVELAVLVGRDAKDVAAADAGSVIAGYSVANDISLRDFSRRTDYPFFPDWLRSKSFAGCLPLGPAVIPAAFVPDPMRLDLSLSVNGDQRQASSTENMIFSVAEQIEYLSHIAPLRAGDVILTGTPAGTGRTWAKFLSPGDVMVAEVQGLGRLETRVTAGKRAGETGT
ncbi:MAG TPA: fumarylacetoacetate hydrolase family protein [Trebonia sp.]|jgi:2-keto-4-pentenoate hydratase/2-oxohepta-3-ene-1,7-dioic acid hydratase in catechol pathway